MRELVSRELDCVTGAFGLLTLPAGIGLAVCIPTIVFGAIAGVPTGGLGFVVMAAGIVGTALSGAAMIASIAIPII